MKGTILRGLHSFHYFFINNPLVFHVLFIYFVIMFIFVLAYILTTLKGLKNILITLIGIIFLLGSIVLMILNKQNTSYFWLAFWFVLPTFFMSLIFILRTISYILKDIRKNYNRSEVVIMLIAVFGMSFTLYKAFNNFGFYLEHLPDLFTSLGFWLALIIPFIGKDNEILYKKKIENIKKDLEHLKVGIKEIKNSNSTIVNELTKPNRPRAKRKKKKRKKNK